MAPLPRELVEALEKVLHPKESAVSAAGHPEAARRVGVAIACWLRGSVTVEEAIKVLRRRSRSRP